MLKASVLYMVVVIALVIGIFCASLISVAYFYRQEHQKSLRYAKLEANLYSGESVLLSKAYVRYGLSEALDLFGEQNDSLLLRKEHWGIFDLAMVHAFVQMDTLKKAFLVALDGSSDQSAVYLSDEDRPISVSGSTQITGEVELPKAGIKQAYVEGRPYAGKELVNGMIRESGRKLPPLDRELIQRLQDVFKDSTVTEAQSADSLFQSFFSGIKRIRISSSDPNLRSNYSGKILISCDTVLTIHRESKLQDVLVFAPGIIVEEGFRGRCQLFASDSVFTGKKVVFDYPSVIGVLSEGKGGQQPKIQLGGGSLFSGILFSYEKTRSDLQTIISLGKDCLVKGEVYAAGFIKLEKPLTIEGKVWCNRFIIQTPTTLYENYLIDITINRLKRSPYYLTSPLFSADNRDQRILKWLN